MQHKEQATCSTQIDVALGGEYCTIKPEYMPNGMKGNPTAQTSRQDAQSSSSKPENNNIKVSPKRKLARSTSSPEQIVRSHYVNVEPSQKLPAQANGTPRTSGPFVVTPGRRSTGHIKVGGRRSTGSLTGREPPPPLRYFAYLGRLHPSVKTPQRPRGRLPSAHDILADRPVILTSTSIVSPYATNVICQEIEELEQQEREADYSDLLDCCTCMCCVKALFYHCTKDTKSEGHLAEHPCSCQGPVNECVCRWGVMGLVSIFLPCLLCYLPFEACFRCHECMTKEDNTESSKFGRIPATESSVTDQPIIFTTGSRTEL